MKSFTLLVFGFLTLVYIFARFVLGISSEIKAEPVKEFPYSDLYPVEIDI